MTSDMSDDLPTIYFRRLRPEQDADIALPAFMTPRAAGMDVRAAVTGSVTIAPGAIVLIPTGFAMAIPTGYEAQIRPRSGLAVRHGIGVINAPGTIDADFRGEVQVALINLGTQPFEVKRGDRIAQMVIGRIWPVRVALVTHLDKTDRNGGGFGHTGV